MKKGKYDDKQKTMVVLSWSKDSSKYKYSKYYFFLRSPIHRGQYHLPFGFDVRFTHGKWNHSIGHCKITGTVISYAG